MRESPREDVQLVPVTILWGRAPQQQDSILKALFAESWRPPGHLRQLMAILLHGRQVLVHFGAPMSLGELVREDGDPALIVRKVQRILRVHFRRQRETAIGPDLSHRNNQMDQLLAAAPVQAAIVEEMATRSIPYAAAYDRARGFAREIVSDYSFSVVRAFELFLTWLWTRLYDGVEVHNFDVMAKIAPGQGIVYIPCHRSHIDYLLMSYVVYKRGLTPPHIAAGANLNFPVVGPLLRRGGAFFLRRSFKGEPVYAAVFNEYLHLMISRGFPIEYFIEGTRSRTGRMLPPRTGILGMTLKSYLRGQERPLVFVPVYIGYEKLIEGRSFLNELSGKPKRKESLWSLLGMLRELKREFGKVHVNFGRPLPLAEYFDRARPNWRDEMPGGTPDWLREATAGAALELTRRINEAAVVNPINLVALALLATPKHAADEETLRGMIEHYQMLFRHAPYSPLTVFNEEPADAAIEHARRLGVVERLAHPLGDLIKVSDGEAPLLAYFRNNVLHLVALPALVACLLTHNARLGVRRVAGAIGRLLVLAQSELFFRCAPEDVATSLDPVLTVLEARGLIQRQGQDLVAPDPTSRAADELRLLGETMRPTLERYLLTLVLLEQHGSGNLARNRLEEISHLLAQRLALLYESNTSEFAERGLFANVVGNLLTAGLLRQDEQGLLYFDERISAPAADAELLLSAGVRQTIRRMAGAGLSTSAGTDGRSGD
ncbi:MAG: glycerol-3-phosphate 1-O-acyltransferase PlsB [Rhodocyclales bacterium]|nr:glycerol-3-phosphate 1-O-acyltransferase PlsB [Rhodocyclales bacterium]